MSLLLGEHGEAILYGVVGVMLILGIILIFVALVHKPRQLKPPSSPSVVE